MNTFKRLILFLSVIGLLGGCGMTSKEVTLTKEQQDNVVRWIARNYEISSIEFLEFSQDSKTGTYLLNMQINSSKDLETTLPIRQLTKELGEKNVDVGLSPIERFQSIERVKPLEGDIDLSKVRIIYLGE